MPRLNPVATVAFIVGLTMASIVGAYHAKIDLYPHLSFDLPRQYTMTCTNNIVRHNECDVVFDNTIPETYEYAPLITSLAQASHGDIYRFHLAGFGGDALAAVSLYNELHATKAKVIMMVTGPVFSAHAVLAISGDELIAPANTFLMFHDVQMDRSKMQQADLELLNMFHQFLISAVGPYLTPDELGYILANPDNQVYISGPDMVKRFRAVHKERDEL